jgi:hypothetical protein
MAFMWFLGDLDGPTHPLVLSRVPGWPRGLLALAGTSLCCTLNNGLEKSSLEAAKELDGDIRAVVAPIGFGLQSPSWLARAWVASEGSSKCGPPLFRRTSAGARIPQAN